jgi:Protein of unknown function (DUF1573)
LTVDRDQIDFGRVPIGKPVTASFKLTNVGDKPLQIEGQLAIQVLKGCSPPRPTVGSTVLQPGQSTELSMEFLMHVGMEGPHDFRDHVKTTDPTQPDKELVVLSDWE